MYLVGNSLHRTDGDVFLSQSMIVVKVDDRAVKRLRYQA